MPCLLLWLSFTPPSPALSATVEVFQPDPEVEFRSSLPSLSGVAGGADTLPPPPPPPPPPLRALEARVNLSSDWMACTPEMVMLPEVGIPRVFSEFRETTNCLMSFFRFRNTTSSTLFPAGTLHMTPYSTLPTPFPSTLAPMMALLSTVSLLMLTLAWAVSSPLLVMVILTLLRSPGTKLMPPQAYCFRALSWLMVMLPAVFSTV